MYENFEWLYRLVELDKMRQTLKKIELNIKTLTVLLKIKTKKYKNVIKKSLFLNLKCLPR